MKKKAHKLTLHRETLRELGGPTLGRAAGRGETMDGDCTQVDSHCPIRTCTCEVCGGGTVLG